jgi:hypothetical protein
VLNLVAAYVSWWKSSKPYNYNYYVDLVVNMAISVVRRIPLLPFP